MSDTVKARERHGADSLDLTIPVEIVREKGLNKGDIFEVDVHENKDKVEITYRRVYNSEN